MPESAHELTEDYIPLEAGLWDSVSFSKGCYIGQEIIARMESRNKLAKTLVVLHFDQPGAPLELGLSVTNASHESVGTLTSIAPTTEGSITALAFVKPDYAEPDTQLHAAGNPARVVSAPLIRARH